MKLKLIALSLLLAFTANLNAQTAITANKNLPIGVFDSGTGGLTVLEAMLRLDAYNNVTGLPGADGKLDFSSEFFEYKLMLASLYKRRARQNSRAGVCG